MYVREISHIMYIYTRSSSAEFMEILINLSITLLVYGWGGCYATVLVEVLLSFYTECCLPSSHHHSVVVYVSVENIQFQLK